MVLLLDNVGFVMMVFIGLLICFFIIFFIGSGIVGFYVVVFWEEVIECYLLGIQLLDLYMVYYYLFGICFSGWVFVVFLESDFLIIVFDYLQKVLVLKGMMVWLCCFLCVQIWFFFLNIYFIFCVNRGFIFDRLWVLINWVNIRDCVLIILWYLIMMNVWVIIELVGVLFDIIVSMRLMVLVKGILIMWQESDSEVVNWWKIVNLFFVVLIIIFFIFLIG